MENKGPRKFWRRVGALSLGFIAGGITFSFLKEALAHPWAHLSVATNDRLLSLDTIAAWGGIIVWVIVYIICMRRWSRYDYHPRN